MGIANLHDYIARVEQVVRDDLQQAQVIALIEVEVVERPEYWERIYYVAWQKPDSSAYPIRERQYGTHRICINSNDEAMCVFGHYDLSRSDAKLDAIERAG